MKTIIILSFILLVSTSLSFAQSQKILDDKDSTLNLYLSHRLELSNIEDSCFAGIYNISFSLFPNGTIREIKTSKTLPKKYSDTLIKIIKNLKNKWQTDFLHFATKKNQRIIQPIYLFVYSDCKMNLLKQNNILLKDSSINAINLTDADELAFELGKIMDQLQQTFSESNIYETTDKGLEECILMKPCVVLTKSQFTLKSMDKNKQRKN